MGKDYLGKDMRRGNNPKEEKEEKEIKSLDEGDIALLKTYGQGQYSKALKQVPEALSKLFWPLVTSMGLSALLGIFRRESSPRLKHSLPQSNGSNFQN